MREGGGREATGKGKGEGKGNRLGDICLFMLGRREQYAADLHMCYSLSSLPHSRLF